METDWSGLFNAWLSYWLALAIYVGWDWYREGELTPRKRRTLYEGVIVGVLTGVVGLIFWVLTLDP